MEWKGYDENFDTTALVDKKDLWKARKAHQTKEALKQRLSKVTMNLVEFLVWAGLLVFCFSYLQSHPAEKSSLFSWAEAIVEKVKVNISQWTKWHGGKLESKFQLEKQYQIIMNDAIRGKCLTPEEIEKIKRALKKLEALSVEDFLQQERAYKTVADIYYKKVKSQCTQTN